MKKNYALGRTVLFFWITYSFAFLSNLSTTAQTEIMFAYDSFTSGNIGTWSINNNTYHDSGNSVLVLTDATGGQRGSAFVTKRVVLDNQRPFMAQFCFQITTPGGNSGADGMAFLIQTESNSAGSSGGGLGYQGISPSLAVEFDTFNNGTSGAFNDLSANHVGINVDGNIGSIAQFNPPFTMDGGTIFYAWVEYNGSTTTLEVRVSTSNTRPANANLSENIDLTSIFADPNVFVGFTAATGGSYSKHMVRSFYFSTEYDAGGLNPATTSYVSATPPGAPTTTDGYNYGPGQVVLQAAGAPAGGSYMWFVDNTTENPIAGATGSQYTTPVITENTTYYVSSVSEFGLQSSTRTPATAVIDYGEAPSDIELSNDTVNNRTVGAQVGTLSSVDADETDTHVYSLVSGTGSDHNSYFTIDGNSLKVNGDLYALGLNTVNIRVMSTDNLGNEFEKTFQLLVSQPPVAVDDSYTIGAGQTLSENLLDNDSDADGDNLSVIAQPTPAQGSFTSFNTSTGEFDFLAPEDYVGTITFTYRITDGFSVPDTGTVTINVEDRSSPVAVVLSPDDEETDVDLSPVISITFDEPIDLGVGAIALSDGNGNIWSYDLTTESAYYSLSNGDSTLNLQIPDRLSAKATITVSVPDGLVKDKAAVPNAVEAFSWSFTTIKDTQSITFNAIAPKTYGDESFTLGDATTDKGLVITYTADDPTVVTISGNTATVLKVGTTTIRANQAGNDTLFAATEVTQELWITSKPITVTADAQSKVYGESDPVLSYQVNPALVDEDVFSGGLVRESGEDIGYYIISQNDLDAGSNYTITYEQDSLWITSKPITVTADAQSKVYGESDPELSYQVVPALVGEDVFSGGLIRESGEDVGYYIISQNDLDAGSNYTITYEQDSLWITSKPITVTADAQSKVYGESDPVLSYQVNPALVDEDVFSGGLVRESGEDIGYYIISQNDLDAGSNYTITYEQDSLWITSKPITVTADAQSKVYGESDPELSYQVNPALVGEDVFSGGLLRESGEDIGYYIISQNDLDAGSNYTITYEQDSLWITSKPITVTADAQNKVYGESDPELSYQVVPALVGEDVFSGELNRVDGETIGTYLINQNSLSAGDNYTIDYLSAELTIIQKPITITADPKTKVYGESDPQLTFSLSTELVEGDELSGSLKREIGENAGSYVIEQNDLSINQNYNIKYVQAAFTIAPRWVVVTPEPGQSKTVGETDPVFAFSAAPALLSGDSFSGELGRISGEQIGTYPFVLGILTAGNNYQIDFASEYFTIKATSNPQVTAFSPADEATEIALVPTLSITFDEPVRLGASGVLSIESEGHILKTYYLNVSGDRNQFSISPDGRTITVVLTDNLPLASIINVSVTEGFVTDVEGNPSDAIDAWSFTTTDNAAQTINFPEITEKTYGDDSFVLGDVFTDQGLIIKYEAEDPSVVRIVGNIATVLQVGNTVITASQPGNGEIPAATPVMRTITVLPKQITVTAASLQWKVVGADDPVLMYTVEPSLESGDEFSGALVRESGEAIGRYHIMQGDLSAGINYVLTFVPDEFEIKSESNSPQIVKLSPEIGAYNVALQPTLAVTFDRPVNLGTQGTIMIWAGNDLLAFFDISKSADRNALALSDDKRTLYIYPSVVLPVSSLITVSLSNALVKDPLGDAFTGFRSWIFTTTSTNEQVINFPEIEEKTYGDEMFVLGDATTDQGLLVTYQADDADIVTIIGNQAMIHKTGTTVITATQAGDENIEPAISVRQTLVVLPKPITVTSTAGLTKLVGEEDPELTYSVAPEMVEGDEMTGILERTPGEAPGAYAIVQGTLSAGENYIVTFISNMFRIETEENAVPNVVSTYPEDGSTDAGLRTILQVTFDEAVYLSHAGFITLQSGGVDLMRYDLSNSGDLEAFSFSEDRKTITLYLKESLPPGSLIEVVSSPDIVKDSDGNSFESSAVWSFTTIGSYGQNITFDEISVKTYGDESFVLGDALTDQGLTVSYTAADPEVVFIEGNVATPLKVGTTIITASQPGDDEILAAANVRRTLVVVPREVVVTVDEGQSKIYGESDPVYTYSVEPPLVAGDAFPGTLNRSSGETVGFYAITQGTLNISDNYRLRFVSNDFEIIDGLAPVPDVELLENVTAYCEIRESDMLVPTATDDIDGQIQGTTVTPFPLSEPGESTITWIFEDAAGNSITQQQTVIVEPSPLQAVTMAGDTVSSNGEVHSLSVSNLPEGAVVSYLNNEHTEPGVYEAQAVVVLEGTNCPAITLTATLVIESNDATIHQLAIGGMVITNPEEEIYYLMDCNDESQSVQVGITTEANATTSTESAFEVQAPVPGIYKKDVVVISQDKVETMTYHITVEKPFRFDDIVVQKFNNVLLVNNNPETNGGYHFVSFEWYKDGQPIGTGQSFSAGDNKNDLLDTDARYKVNLTTDEGDVISTCEFSIEHNSPFALKVTPNPVRSGSTVFVETNFTAEMLSGRTVEIRTIYGNIVYQKSSPENYSPLVLPGNLAPGTYIVTTTAGGVNLSTKIVVQ